MTFCKGLGSSVCGHICVNYPHPSWELACMTSTGPVRVEGTAAGGWQRLLPLPSSSSFLPLDGVEPCLISGRPGGNRANCNQRPGTRGWLHRQRGVLGPPPWPPHPGPSAASWGASCSAGATLVLAPACPACGSPTEVRVGPLFVCMFVGA